MKTSTATILGSILLFLCFMVYILLIEKEDINTVGLLVAIFAIPMVLLGIFNGVILDFANNRKSLAGKRIWSASPLLLLTLLSLSDLRLLDADISFLGLLGLISFGITNMIWNIKLDDKTDKNTVHNKI